MWSCVKFRISKQDFFHIFLDWEDIWDDLLPQKIKEHLIPHDMTP